MKNLFSIFSEKQLMAIKDAIAYGLWGNIDHCFNGYSENVNTYEYCTGDIYKGDILRIKKYLGRGEMIFINLEKLRPP